MIRNAGYEAATITDHDFISTEQVRRARIAAGEMPFIPAAEFSSVYQNKTVHVLGYFLDAENPQLQEHCLKVQEVDREVSAQFLREFQKQGAEFGMEDLIAPSLHTFYSMQLVKRLAAELFDNNPTRTLNAFLKIQQDLKVNYADFAPWPVEEIISLIHQSNGIAVLAHPGGIDEVVMRRLDFYLHDQAAIEKYTGWGLDGIETRTPVHTQSERHYYEGIANQLGLLQTAGSDCHGDDDYLGPALMGNFSDVFVDGYECMLGKWKERAG
jgi:predicted metal-dependent phosphoesterase TrpH